MVLVYAETGQGRIKKSGQEAITYGRRLADLAGVNCAALVLGTVDDAASAGQFGAQIVFHVANDQLDHFDSRAHAVAISAVAQQKGASYIVLSHSANGKSLTGRLAVRLEAGCVSGVTELPNLEGGFTIRKGVFSGKAFADIALNTEIKVLSVMGNALTPTTDGEPAQVEAVSVEVPTAQVTVKQVDKVEGTVPLPEAQVVVSAGRGMKGPENWGIIEELAELLGATTACSRPVADTGWRPHHEHVGQTGIAIRPNLYVAIGISGAIQHLAGVNRSKVIVVINKDPEAPFFKAADYGVVGDLFEVVPRLIEAIRRQQAA